MKEIAYVKSKFKDAFSKCQLLSEGLLFSQKFDLSG